MSGVKYNSKNKDKEIQFPFWLSLSLIGCSIFLACIKGLGIVSISWLWVFFPLYIFPAIIFTILSAFCVLFLGLILIFILLISIVIVFPLIDLDIRDKK